MNQLWNFKVDAFLFLFSYDHVGTQCKLYYEDYLFQNGVVIFLGESRALEDS